MSNSHFPNASLSFNTFVAQRGGSLGGVHRSALGQLGHPQRGGSLGVVGPGFRSAIAAQDDSLRRSKDIMRSSSGDSGSTTTVSLPVGSMVCPTPSPPPPLCLYCIDACPGCILHTEVAGLLLVMYVPSVRSSLRPMMAPCLTIPALFKLHEFLLDQLWSYLNHRPEEACILGKGWRSLQCSVGQHVGSPDMQATGAEDMNTDTSWRSSDSPLALTDHSDKGQNLTGGSDKQSSQAAKPLGPRGMAPTPASRSQSGGAAASTSARRLASTDGWAASRPLLHCRIGYLGWMLIAC